MKDYVNELKHIKYSYCVRLTRSHIIYIQVDVSSLLFFFLAVFIVECHKDVLKFVINCFVVA